MKLWRIYILIISMLVGLLGCDIDFRGMEKPERDFSTTDSKYFEAFKSELTKAGISFKEADGKLYYRLSDDEEEAIFTRITRELMGGVSIKHESEEFAEFQKKYFDRKGIEYRIEIQEGEEWIRYYPPEGTDFRELYEQTVEAYEKFLKENFDGDCSEKIIISATDPSHEMKDGGDCKS